MTSTVVALVASLALVGGVRLALAAAGRRRAAARREQVVDFAEALVGELRAGRPVLAALERSTVSWPEARTAAVAARLGSDVPAVLRDLARLPGAAAARRLAAAFALCSTTGGGLAFAAEQVVETARAEQALDQLVQGELAAARATARLVLLLPVVVLAAADGLGADPWTFLLATPAGTACLAAGVVLALAGLGWIERIAAEAGGGS